MGRHKLSEAVRARTEKKLLTVATRVFAEHGFADVGMRDIAREANMTASKIYQFFPDKQALYERCCEQIFERYSGEVEQTISGLKTPAEQLRAYTEALCEYLLSDRSLSLLLQRQLLDQDEMGFDRLTGRNFRTNFRRVSNWIAALIGEETAAMRAYSLFAFSNGLVFSRVIAKVAHRKLSSLQTSAKISRLVLSTVIPEKFGKPDW